MALKKPSKSGGQLLASPVMSIVGMGTGLKTPPGGENVNLQACPVVSSVKVKGRTKTPSTSGGTIVGNPTGSLMPDRKRG